MLEMLLLFCSRICFVNIDNFNTQGFLEIYKIGCNVAKGYMTRNKMEWQNNCNDITIKVLSKIDVFKGVSLSGK